MYNSKRIKINFLKVFLTFHTPAKGIEPRATET